MNTDMYEMIQTEDAEDRFLTFDLGGERYGIDISQVTEIIGLQSINRMPDMPDYIEGIINLRGKIIPVVDMSTKFKQEKRPHTDRTCIIVVETSHMAVGLIVDSVAEVTQIHDISPTPKLAAGVKAHYITGVGKINNTVVIMIDCEQLFDSQDTLIINTSSEKM